MGFLKKAAKKQKRAINKVVKAEVTKAYANKKVGDATAFNNIGRMDIFFKMFYMTIYCYILRKHFGKTYAAISKTITKMDEYLDMVETKEPWRQNVAWFKAGLWWECDRFRIKNRQLQKKPSNNDAEGWVYYNCDHISKRIIRKNEIIWFWILHTEFGFGKKRMEKANELVYRYEEPTVGEYKMMLKTICDLKPRKNNEERMVLKYDRVIGFMEQLTEQMEDDSKPMTFFVQNVRTNKLVG